MTPMPPPTMTLPPHMFLLIPCLFYQVTPPYWHSSFSRLNSETHTILGKYLQEYMDFGIPILVLLQTIFFSPLWGHLMIGQFYSG
jgi:hypothetical protein